MKKMNFLVFFPSRSRNEMGDPLGLLNLFSIVLYSRIFELVLKKADVDGSKAVHIGNSYVSP